MSAVMTLKRRDLLMRLVAVGASTAPALLPAAARGQSATAAQATHAPNSMSSPMSNPMPIIRPVPAPFAQVKRL